MSETTKENLLDSFAIAALKSLIGRTSYDASAAYKLAEEAYIISEQMIERREKILNKWQLAKDVLNQGLARLDLTIRTQRCLEADRIFTIEQLLRCTERRLMKVPNLGKKSITEIVQQLAARGYTLNDYT